MGGTDDAHIDRLFRHATDLAHAFFLNGAQQLDLHRERQIGHFIQKQRPAVGCLKKAFTVAVGTGKRPLAVAEKLAFHQVFRNRPAVDRDKRTGIAGAARVNQPRRQFLATAGFTGNIDRRLAACQLFDHRPDLLHAGRIANQRMQRVHAFLAALRQT